MQEFNQDGLNVTLERGDNCQVKLTIEASPARGEKCYKEAIKNLKKQLSVPGFRKGKVPEQYIRDHFADKLQKGFKQEFIDDTIQGALQLTQTYPWSDTEKLELNPTEISREKGCKATCTFIAFPDVPTIDLTRFHLDEETITPITDEKVKNYIDEIIYHHVEWIPVTDRAIQEGDFADIEATIASQEKNETRLLIQKERTRPWIYDAILGKQIGDEFDVQPIAEDINPHETHPVQRVINETPLSPAHIKVLGICTAILPPIDDALAQKMGAKNLEDLLTKSRKTLERQAKEEIDERQGQKLIDQIVDTYTFDVPSVPFNREKQTEKERLIDVMRKAQIEEKTIQGMLNVVEEEAAKTALQNMRRNYLLSKYKREHNLKISNEEITLRSLTIAYKKQWFHLVNDNPTFIEHLKSRAHNELFYEKTIDHMMSQLKKSVERQ